MANNWKYWNRSGQAVEWAHGVALPAGADLFRAEFLNQFVTAINERAHATGFIAVQDRVPTVETGDDVQAITFWQEWFDGVKALLRFYCDERIESVAGLSLISGAQPYTALLLGRTGGASATDQQRFDALLGAAGLSGLRHSEDGGQTYTTEASVDQSWIASGEYIGAWMLEDMRALLYALVRTANVARSTESQLWRDDLTESYATCEAAFAASIAAWSQVSSSQSGTPVATWSGSLVQGTTPPYRWSASASASIGNVAAPLTVSAPVPCTYVGAATVDIQQLGWSALVTVDLGTSASPFFPAAYRPPDHAFYVLEIECPEGSAFKTVSTLAAGCIADYRDYFTYR